VVVVGVYARVAHSGGLEMRLPDASDTHYNLLVQGFRAGQLNLKKSVPPGLAQLTDPYDPAANARFRTGSDRLHDVSYYKGKLYLYYGVTPVLLLLWPFAALTGHYLYSGQATAFFCALGFLAGAGVLHALWRRYFPEVSVWVVAAAVLALGLATGVPVMLPRSGVYEVAVSCGCMLMMLSLGAIWCALHETRRRSWWLAAASVAYGLAVGARPSLLFGAIILLVPVVQARYERRPVGALLVAAIGPLTVIGLGLMLYNAMRFDSPFEFGVRYQLAGTSFPQFFSVRFLWFNFRYYFLEPVHWKSSFPFMGGITVPPLPVGRAVEDTFGVLTNVPVVLLALALPLAWRGRPPEARTALRVFLAAVALFFGIYALTVSLFVFACIRYEVEFLLPLVLLAAVGILGLERALAPTSESGLADRPAWRRAARLGWGLLLGFSVAFNLLASVVRCAAAYNNMGITAYQAGQREEAVEHYQRALWINPDYAEAHVNLGAIFLQEGKVGDAIGQYEQALRIKPDFAEAHYNLGAALMVLGKVPEAAEHFEQALRIKPDYVPARNALARLHAGQ